MEAGFAVTEPAENAAHALALLPHVEPSLLVMVQELIGLSGTEAMPHIAELEHPPEIVLLTTDTEVSDTARSLGAFGVVDRLDTTDFADVLSDVRYLLETGEQRGVGERRRGEDRRTHQDWQKVTRERRVRDDRRDGDRRDD